jgi:MFS family permease
MIARAKWWILVFTSLAMFGNFYVYDSIAPVADLLHRQLGFSDTQIGTLNAIYSLPNIVLVLIGGVLTDRFGAARVTLWTTVICFAGAVLTALGAHFPVMAAGRLLFGIGAETFNVAVLVAITHWFKGGGLALAMAAGVGIGRLGSYGADLSPTLLSGLYARGWQPPLWFAAALAASCVLMALLYGWLDRRVKAPVILKQAGEDRFRLADLASFSRSFWYLLALNVLFYGVIFPFRSTFSIEYFQHAHGLSLAAAGRVNSFVFLAAVFATPAFGWLADRIGQRSLLLVFGSLLLPLSFVILAITSWNLWITTVLIGISFSLVPAVIWPCVSYIVEAKRVGTAFGLINVLQNLALTAINVAAGALNDANGAGAAHPAGYLPMLWFFTVLSGLGGLFALLLWRREAGQASRALDLPEHALGAG